MRYIIRNTSGEVYPAYGCGRLKSILSTDEPTGNPVFELVKPDGQDGIYVVNGPNNLPNNQLGVANSIEEAKLVLVDDGDVSSAPEFGEICGPEEDRWAATVAGVGLRATGVVDNRVMPVTANMSVSSGVLQIRFRIVTVFCELCQAIAVVMSRPPGMARVPQEDIYGQLRVYDLHGWLQEPDRDLEGRYGSATLLTWDQEACAIDPELHTKWEITSLFPQVVECPIE